MATVYIVNFCHAKAGCFTRETVFVSDADDRAVDFIKQNGRRRFQHIKDNYWFSITKAHINDASSLEVINQYDKNGNVLPN